MTRLPLLPVHETFLSQLVRVSNASLAARVKPGIKIEDACVTPPDSKYRGAENQLYRVEIHRSGTAGQATFKWSRDNGSVATAWIGGEASDLQVASTRGFAAGSWVELCDDNCDLLGLPGALVQLAKVEGDTLSVDPATTLPSIDDYPANPKVRLWNQMANDLISLADDHAITIQESPAGATADKMLWFDLEDWRANPILCRGNYRTGDLLVDSRSGRDGKCRVAAGRRTQSATVAAARHRASLCPAWRCDEKPGKMEYPEPALRVLADLFLCANPAKIPEPTDAGPRPVVDPVLSDGPRPVISADRVFVPPQTHTQSPKLDPKW